MPLNLVSHAHQWTKRQITRGADPVRVLIVDDYTVGCEALALLLTLEGWNCRTASCGRDAVNLGHSWAPEIVLMDIAMPGLDGYQSALAMRRDPQAARLLIFALTALNEYQVKQRVEHIVFDGYIQKAQSSSVLSDFLLRVIKQAPMHVVRSANSARLV